VIKFADFIGDSLKLARAAARAHGAEFIVFCGVHFMAESADILRAPHQKVDPAGPRRRLLDGRHGREDQLEIAWRELAEMGVDVSTIVPVTYINSSAAIKAFVGAHGGVVCTSTNAAAVMTWAWERGEKTDDAARPAPRAEHRPTSSACRSIAWSCGIRTRSAAV
jgi:quinolinate synthase